MSDRDQEPPCSTCNGEGVVEIACFSTVTGAEFTKVETCDACGRFDLGDLSDAAEETAAERDEERDGWWATWLSQNNGDNQ